jgi:hypothetical protein
VGQFDSNEQLRNAEAELGVTFPADYREFIAESGRVERDFGGSWLVLYDADEIVPLNRGYELSETCPGLVLIGSDGGGEAVGFDFRDSPPHVVLVNFVSAGWQEAITQADSFTEFMAQRDSGLGYSFGQ